MCLSFLLQQNQELKQLLRSVLSQAPVLHPSTVHQIQHCLFLYDQPRDYLSPLPREVLLLIFSCLDYADICCFARCSHTLSEISQTHSLWTGLILRRWTGIIDPNSIPLQVYKAKHSLEMRWYCHRPVVSTMKGYRGTITSISFLPQSSSFLATSDDGSAGLWHYQDQANPSADLFQQHHRQTKAVYRTASFYGHGGPVWASTVTSSKLATGSSDMTVKLWGKAGKCEGTLRGHGNWVTALAALGEKLVSGSYDSTVRLWDVDNREELAVYQQETAEDLIYALDVRPDQVVTGSIFPVLAIRDLVSGEILIRLQGHEDAVSTVKFADEHMLASGGKDQTVRVWDKRTGNTEEVLRGHTSNVMCLAVEWEARRVVSGSHDKTICVWDLRKATAPRNILMGHSAAIFCLQCTDNKIVSGSSDKTIKIWNFISC